MMSKMRFRQGVVVSVTEMQSKKVQRWNSEKNMKPVAKWWLSQ